MGLPLHPLVVHVPLCLALLAPALVGGLAWLVWRRRAGGVEWLFVVGIQLVLVASTVTATITGEDDGRQVESVVGRVPIDAHEDAAQIFLVAAVSTLGLLIGAAALTRHALALLLGAFVIALVTAVLGVRTGHKGGELVYRHGAASAHDGYAPRDRRDP